MNINKLPGSKIQFEVVIPVETFKKALEDSFEKNNANAEIPGFRKGKAPKEAFLAKYGKESLYADALNFAIGETYALAIDENKLDVCGYPKIDLDEKKINEEEPIHYFVTVSVTPEVTLGQYKGLAIEKAKVSVSAKEVDAEIKAALEKESMLVRKTGDNVAIEVGNTVVFDFEGFVDGVAFEGGKASDYQLEIGSHQFIPGFEEGMVGMKEGESKDVAVKFPEDYHAENLKGKDAIFKVAVKEIKVKEVPALDDEFVKEQKIEGVADVESYKKHVKEHIKEHKEHHAEEDAENKLYTTIIENAKFDLPEDLVEDEAHQQFHQTEAQAKQYNMPIEMMLQYMGGMTVEQYKDYLKAQAKSQLSLKFVLKEIAKAEKFEISKEEIEAKYEEYSKHYNMSVDQIKSQLSDEMVKEEISTQKAFDFVKTANPFVAPAAKKEEK